LSLSRYEKRHGHGKSINGQATGSINKTKGGEGVFSGPYNIANGCRDHPIISKRKIPIPNLIYG
jgi:hypothetical protein